MGEFFGKLRTFGRSSYIGRFRSYDLKFFLEDLFEQEDDLVLVVSIKSDPREYKNKKADWWSAFLGVEVY